MTHTEERFQAIRESLKKTCSCGQNHAISLRNLYLHEGALTILPEAIAEIGEFKHITMICDRNTYEACGKEVEKIVPVTTICLDPFHLHANEIGVEKAESELAGDTDLLLAVGSGTIHDITRYIAYQHKIPFVSVPTAASVDGFVSTVAAMTWKGVKRTLTAVGPTIMVADSRVLAKAPKTLTASGLGDLIGKYTALTDWKLGRLLKNEYYCEEIVALEEEAMTEVLSDIESLATGDTVATEKLMYGLVLSGLAMQMAGNSRPASGSEHHISHIIEMKVLNGENEALHGEKVGVGTAMVCDLYHKIAKLTKDEVTFDPENVLTDSKITEVFGTLADEIRKENEKDSAAGITKELLQAHWDEIVALLSALPTGDEVRTMIQKVGGSTTLTDIGLPSSMEKNLLFYAPMVRNRLTMLRLFARFK